MEVFMVNRLKLWFYRLDLTAKYTFHNSLFVNVTLWHFCRRDK